jgi:hypothetical protein
VTLASLAFSGHLICGISGCYLVGEIVVVGFLWGTVAEGRVEPFGIVAEFDVACHILSRMVSGGIYGAIDPLNFQSSIKRFCERVIVTDAGSADGASNTVAVAIAGKFFGHVLGAYCVPRSE